MAFDYKKEYKEFYMPKNKPSIIKIPKMNYLAVRGKGDPNKENGDYKKTIGLLYGIAFTIKMSYKGTHKIDGFFHYVVPPLEGFWWQENTKDIDYNRKDEMHFISLIRLPDFVTKKTVAAMHKFANDQGYELDITDTRYHHEIYLSDPRRCDVNKLKTVIRNPIKKTNSNFK